ncbi:hypothetical protein ACIBHX_23735 [Nonomuraea sp. NPDC050536]|uniref:hypothetical protein n=1 Tax=Nonomuraea sp. NPDC050536 TaxID=3364366 RepID=UPI0037C83F45
MAFDPALHRRHMLTTSLMRSMRVVVIETFVQAQVTITGEHLAEADPPVGRLLMPRRCAAF